ncbi:glycosyltransferase family 71 protein [Aulographum hederae CBS 113979]|uniref:Glycosyltransferase family 71 protein n=1 Tax=Aulographum hederae CBS 113979 TaxID=1176131 RepID=A0A6G1H146_9PEZI|nr:glycosyltransferase family 71 protein [Aulographum hederae CBS 113979]
MRVTLRRQLILVVVLLTLTVLWYTNPRLIGADRLSAFSSEHGLIPQFPHLRSSPIDPHVLSIRRFWSPWATTIQDSAPQVDPVNLVYSANIIKPVNDGPREIHQNLVSISDEDEASLRAAHAKLRTVLDAYDHLEDAESHFSGTGVVTVAGGEYFGPFLAGLHMLRSTGSSLPVEAFLADSSEYEAALCEKVLPSLNAKCKILADFLQASNSTATKFKVEHYQLKSLAILFSSFTHTLFLDSDSIPLLDPAVLFSTEAYTSTGFIGWPDFWTATESPIFYSIANMTFPSDLPATSSEAGQLLVDKSRHLKTLLLAAYYNIYGPDWYYPLLSQGALGQGDKNTFETAAIVLGLPYHRVRTPVATVGRMDGREVKGSGMIQHHPNPPSRGEGKDSAPMPAFLHANTPKMNAGHLVDEGDLQDTHTAKHLRLWNSKEEAEKMFGEDLERRVWKEVVEVGCAHAKEVREWKDRKRLCERLHEHVKAVFGD